MRAICVAAGNAVVGASLPGSRLPRRRCLPPRPARRRQQHPAVPRPPAAAGVKPVSSATVPEHASAGFEECAPPPEPASAAAAASGGGGGGSLVAAGAPPRRWDVGTRLLMHLATLAVLGDAVLRATAQAAAGPAGLQGAWVPLASNLTSYLILSSTFLADGEPEAVLCYMAGLACTLGLLAQAFLMHTVPPAIFWPALLLAAGAAAVNGAKLAGWLEPPSPAAGAWQSWRRITHCLGWAMVPQIVYLTLVLPAAAATGTAAPISSASWGPAVVSLGIGAALQAGLSTGRLPASWRSTWDVASWTATLLFMLEPLAALAEAARSPGTLLTLAPTDFLLPALATGLQVPRALWRDHMWTTGTSWATLFACLQAACVAAAQGKLATAAVAVVAPLACAAWLLRGVAAGRGSDSPLGALRPVLAVYRREMLPLIELGARLGRRAVHMLRMRGKQRVTSSSRAANS